MDFDVHVCMQFLTVHVKWKKLLKVQILGHVGKYSLIYVCTCSYVVIGK